MTGRERIIFALVRIRKTTQTAKLAVGVETVGTACYQLVTIGLMTNIPYNPVIGRIEYVMKSHCKLHRTHTGGEVTRI